MTDIVYVVGHKNPDTDSVCSAILYADLLNKRGIEARAAVQGQINNETRFVLERFETEIPENLTDATGKAIAVVDHSEIEQAPENFEPFNLVAVVDHHKLGTLQSSSPITYVAAPLGSTASIIYGMYAHYGVEIETNLKGLMLASILSDTVILKSPTTTEQDKKIVEQLADDLGISYEAFGKEQFNAKADISGKSIEEVLEIDSKVYGTGKGKIAISQVELSDLKPILAKKQEYLTKMRELMDRNGFLGFMLLVTDIINEGSELLIVSDNPAEFEIALKIKLEGGSAFVPGLMSRKKQILPLIDAHFK